MIAQLLQYVAFLAASILGKPRADNGVISWPAVDRARRVAGRPGEAAIAWHLKHGPIITASADGLCVFGQYGFISRPAGRLFVVGWEEGRGCAPHERSSVNDRDAVLFKYCRDALSCIAKEAAESAWQRALRPIAAIRS